MRGRRLRSVDEANLVLDRPNQVNVFLATGILAPGGFVDSAGHLDVDALRDHLERRLPLVPALRRVPVGDRRHKWVDRTPDLAFHVRVEPPWADLHDVATRCAHLMTVPLSYQRPLWELLVARQSNSRNACFILRIHHATADGVSAARITRRLFDEDDPAPAPARTERGERPPDTPIAALRRALFGARRVVSTLRAHGIPDTVLLGPRSPHHGIAFLDADLTGIGSSAHRRGATINDALLCAAAAGYRAALQSAGEDLPAELAVSVPVALPRHDEANAVGVMLVRLPLHGGTEDRLRRIVAQTQAAKIQAREQGTLELMRGPYGAHLMDRIARRQHLVGGFVTNVPGPARAMSLAGAPVTRVWPAAVLAANVRMGMAAVSYAGRLCCGIHVDLDAIDLAAVTAAVERDLTYFAQ